MVVVFLGPIPGTHPHGTFENSMAVVWPRQTIQPLKLVGVKAGEGGAASLCTHTALKSQSNAALRLRGGLWYNPGDETGQDGEEWDDEEYESYYETTEDEVRTAQT